MISGRRIGVRSGNCNYCQWSLGLNCGCRSDNYRRPALQRAPLVPNVGPDNAPTPQFWEFLGHDGSLVRWLKWIFRFVIPGLRRWQPVGHLLKPARLDLVCASALYPVNL